MAPDAIPPSPPLVGIVVLNWNNEPATRRVLDSLTALTAPAHRVYVVDNGSSDGSMDHLERDFARAGFAFLRNGENRGFSGGCNPGIRRALADGAAYVLLLNNDCIAPDPGFVSALVDAAERSPRVGLIGGKILGWPDRGTIWSTGGHVSAWRQGYIGAGEADRGQYDRPAARTFLSGALMLVKREVFERIGLLPEEYFFGHEDWEFSLRARQAGFELRYEPTAVVHHEAGHSHDAVEPFYVYNDALSRMLFEKRALSGPAFALWWCLYGVYLGLVLPLWMRLRAGRYLANTAPGTLAACLRAAHRDILAVDRVTPRSLERFRAKFKGDAVRPWRIVHLVATSGASGVESHLELLLESLKGAGHDPCLVCPEEGPLTERLRVRGIEVRLAAPRGRTGLVDLARTACALADADLVHAHGPRAIWWSAAIARAWGGRKTVATVHQFDLSGLGSWRRPLFAAIERRALRAHTRVIAVSRGLRDQVVRETGLPPDVVKFVPNSSPLLLAPPGAPRSPSSPRAVVVARLHRVKGVDVLLDAWAACGLGERGIGLDVVGDGPERSALEMQARALGLGDRVRFLGWHDRPANEIAGATVYVAPSRSETFGIAVLEAMALGVPVIATDVFGHRDLLGGEFEDLLVPPEQPAALAAALVAMFARDDAWRVERGRALALRARREFAPARMVEGTCAVYAEALGASTSMAATGHAGEDRAG